MLDIPHFAAHLLNPGAGYITDFNVYLPWEHEWYVDGIQKEDYRTTDKCIKNESNLYRPT